MNNNKNPQLAVIGIFKPQTEAGRSKLRSIELSSSNKNYKGSSINFFRIFPSDLTGSLDDFYLNSVFRGFCL